MAKDIEQANVVGTSSPESKKRPWLWAVVFGLVFLLSQDQWLWNGAPPLLGPFNFPLRIYYFLFLQLLLAVLLGLFLARRPGRTKGKED